MNIKILIEEIYEELKNAANGKTLLTLIEASALSNISVSTLRRKVLAGDLQALRPHGKYLIRLSDLAEFLARGWNYKTA